MICKAKMDVMIKFDIKVIMKELHEYIFYLQQFLSTHVDQFRSLSALRELETVFFNRLLIKVSIGPVSGRQLRYNTDNNPRPPPFRAKPEVHYQ